MQLYDMKPTIMDGVVEKDSLPPHFRKSDRTDNIGIDDLKFQDLKVQDVEARARNMVEIKRSRGSVKVNTTTAMDITTILNPVVDIRLYTTMPTPMATAPREPFFPRLPSMIAEPIEFLAPLPHVSRHHGLAKKSKLSPPKSRSAPSSPRQHRSPRHSRSPLPSLRQPSHHQAITIRRRRQRAVSSYSDNDWSLNSDGFFEHGPDHGSPGKMYSSRVPPYHSNKAYDREQVHYIRYMKEDCGIAYKEILPGFMARFPNHLRDSDQCLSSRYYRDNKVPVADKDGNLQYDSRGNMIMRDVPVRGRTTPVGKELCIPFTLVDMRPWLAIQYEWVSKEHKEIARNLLQGIDPTDPEGKKKEWRRLIKLAEDAS